jgi:hypothetical protein
VPARKPPALGPADAKRALVDLLAIGDVEFSRKYLTDDVAALRRVYQEDAAFTGAIFAVVAAIEDAIKHPKTYGTEAKYKLEDWRRGSFSSAPGSDVNDLRLICAPSKTGGIRLLAFGHRDTPESIYRAAGRRV